MTTRAPKPPRKAPTTRWGRFLVDERLKRGWFQKDAFEHFRTKFGWGEESRASYGNWERGTAEPSGDVATAILADYGYTELPPEQEETSEAKATEVELLVGIVGDLITEIQADRAERVSLQEEVATLKAAIASLTRQAIATGAADDPVQRDRNRGNG